jgi:hypothetical protein
VVAELKALNLDLDFEDNMVGVTFRVNEDESA